MIKIKHIYICDNPRCDYSEEEEYSYYDVLPTPRYNNNNGITIQKRWYCEKCAKTVMKDLLKIWRKIDDYDN